MNSKSPTFDIVPNPQLSHRMYANIVPKIVYKPLFLYLTVSCGIQA